MATQNTAMDNAALIKEVNEAHKHKKYSVGYHAQTVVAVIVTLIMLFPLYWMIATSFKSAEEVQLVIPTLFPHEFHPENYLNVLQKANFMKYYWNTIVMTAGILLLQVGTGVLAAYGFAVGRFKGRNALFYVVLGALMIPPAGHVHPHLHHVCQLEPVRYVPGPDFAGSGFRLLHLHAAEHVHVH